MQNMHKIWIQQEKEQLRERELSQKRQENEMKRLKQEDERRKKEEKEKSINDYRLKEAERKE